MSDVSALVAHLPPTGGVVTTFWWDLAERDEQQRSLARAAYQRRLVVADRGSAGNGHEWVRLVPQVDAPVRCCAGHRGAGKRRRSKWRRRLRDILAADTGARRYRDALAAVVGWDVAVQDPRFLEMMRAASPRGRSRRRRR